MPVAMVMARCVPVAMVMARCVPVAMVMYNICTHRGFIPSPGILHHLVAPPTSSTVRVDTGVRQGDHVTTFYDPMIAKLVVWSKDRHSALNRLRAALAQYEVIPHYIT